MHQAAGRELRLELRPEMMGTWTRSGEAEMGEKGMKRSRMA